MTMRRDALLVLAAAACGFAWGHQGLALLIVLAAAVPLLWGMAGNRWTAGAVALAYYLAASHGLPFGVGVFFAESAPAWFGWALWAGGRRQARGLGDEGSSTGNSFCSVAEPAPPRPISDGVCGRGVHRPLREAGYVKLGGRCGCSRHLPAYCRGTQAGPRGSFKNPCNLLGV